MRSKLISCVLAGALGATVALTSPVQARGGGGMGGGMHAAGMGGGCISAPWAAACASAGADSRVRILCILGSRPGLRGSSSEAAGFSAMTALPS